MKLKNMALTLTLTLFSALSLAGVVNVKGLIQNAVATGDNATITIEGSINAIGEPFNVDTATNQGISLGTISSVTEETLTLPAAGGYTLYNFTPTEGAQAGKKVIFAFKRHEKARRGQYIGKEVIEVYRQKRDNPQAIWGRFGRDIFGDAVNPTTGQMIRAEVPQTVQAKLLPNGDVIATFTSKILDKDGKDTGDVMVATTTYELGYPNLGQAVAS